MKKFSKVIVFLSACVLLFSAIPIQSASAYTYKSGNKTYECTTQKSMTAKQVKSAAKEMKALSGKVNYLTLVVAWFNRVIGTGMGALAIGLGTSKDTWQSAADKGQKARQDFCKNLNYNGYNGHSMTRYLFYK